MQRRSRMRGYSRRVLKQHLEGQWVRGRSDPKYRAPKRNRKRRREEVASVENLPRATLADIWPNGGSDDE